MHTGKRFGLFCLILAMASAETPDWSEVNRLVDRAGSDIRPGVEVLLYRDGRSLYERAAGGWTAGRRAAIASSTKWLSGAVVMAMVDAGKLSLDDTVGRFFPNAPDETKPITVRQLMSHTSGMGAEDDCTGSNTTTLAACAERILAQPLAAKPGAVFAYGGASMHVAGRIVEIVSGQDWNTVFRETVAGPLGMTETDYGLNNQRENPRIAGGAISSARDYLRFLAMLLQGGTLDGQRVLSESSVEAMLADQTAGARIAFTPYAQYGDLNAVAPLNRYGIGNWVEVADQDLTPDVNSSGGAFGCVPWLDRERGYAGIFLTQNLLRNAAEHYYPIRQAVEGVLDGPSPLSRRTFLFERRVRGYWWRMPSEPAPEKGYPVVLALHGAGSSGPHFARLSGFATMPDLAGALVVFPEGAPVRPGASHFTWNADSPAGPDDAGFLNELLDRLSWEVPVDFSRVWLAGVSSGGAMAWRMACEAPWRFAAIAAVNGEWTFGAEGYDGTARVSCNPQWTVPLLALAPDAGRATPEQFWISRQECALPALEEPLAGQSLQRAAPCRHNAEVWSGATNPGAPVWPDGTAELVQAFWRRFSRGEGFVTIAEP